MVVRSNLNAMNSNRMLGLTNSYIAKDTERLSSGYRVNRSADDAAGLAISEKMRRQIRGLNQASRNCQDGVSFCQIADGALDEVHGMLKRCEQLAIQASNETNSDEDRLYLDQEVQALSAEIDRVHETSVFNELRVFTDAGIVPDKNGHINASGNQESPSYTMKLGENTVTFGVLDINGNIAVKSGEQATGTENSDSIKNSALAGLTVDAASMAVSKLNGLYGGLFTAASSSDIKVGLELSPQSPGNTLATASLSMSATDSSTMMSYKLWVDTSDYPLDISDSSKKANLAATVAHEMTHLVMFDTLTKGMIGGTKFPSWFVEGTAQTSSGDNGWFNLDSSSSDAEISNYMSKIETMPYGAGYAACMYLGYAASGAGSVTSANIAAGLNKVFKNIADNIKDPDVSDTDILNKAIKDATNNKYSGISDFVNKFSSAGAGSDEHNFMKSFITARGVNGAGSLFGSLNDSEASIFGNPSGSAANYKINKDTNWYSNAFGSGFTFPEDLPSSGGGAGGGNDRAGFQLQVGVEAGNLLYVHQFNASARALLGNQQMSVATVASAQATMDIVKDADTRVSAIRSYYGGVQNRLEHTIHNLDNVAENTTAAESQIRDTDMSKTMVDYSGHNILQQAGSSMLAQANQSQQGILQLLS